MKHANKPNKYYPNALFVCENLHMAVTARDVLSPRPRWFLAFSIRLFIYFIY